MDFAEWGRNGNCGRLYKRLPASRPSRTENIDVVDAICFSFRAANGMADQNQFHNRQWFEWKTTVGLRHFGFFSAHIRRRTRLLMLPYYIWIDPFIFHHENRLRKRWWPQRADYIRLLRRGEKKYRWSALRPCECVYVWVCALARATAYRYLLDAHISCPGGHCYYQLYTVLRCR